jgi:hypothetical protein
MSKPARFITHHDILKIQGWAKENLIAMPGDATMLNLGRPMNQGERLAVAYVGAVLSLLGEDTIHVKVQEGRPPDSEPLE